MKNIIASLNNMTLATKMSVIAVFALCGLLVPSYFYVTLSLEAQATAEQELRGIPPIYKTIKLMKTLAEHRGLSARVLAGDEAAVGLLRGVGKEVDEGFSELDKYIQINIDSVNVKSQFSSTKAAWQNIKNAVTSRNIDGDASFEAHSDGILELGYVVAKLMQHSSLSYHAGAASYHMIIANFNNLPKLADTLGKIRGYGSQLLSRGQAQSAEQAQMVGHLSALNIHYTDFINNLQAAADNDVIYSSMADSALNIEATIGQLKLIVENKIIQQGQLTYLPSLFFDESTNIINNLYNIFDESVLTLEQDITQQAIDIASQRNISLLIILLVMLIGTVIGFMIIKSINGSVTNLVKAFKHISAGKFDFEFDMQRKDEMGTLNQELSLLNIELQKADLLAIEAARVKQALDNSSTCFMIANNEREIIYLNSSVKAMLKECEEDLKAALPHFNADKVMGEKIDIFHKNPAHQKSILENLTQKYLANIQIGKLNFRLLANPVYSASGERLGTVVEWLDRTNEVLAETEIALMVDAALQGDFTQRVSTSGKEDFLLRISEGLNQLIDVTENGLTSVSQVLMAIADGDLTKRVDSDYQGTFDDMKNACNSTSINLTDMISDILIASETIHNASNEIARGNSDLSTRTEQQASNLEETASSMQQLTSTVRLNADNAKQANGLATQASEVAKTGGELIQKVVTTMTSINESSRKISDIIGVIDGIAFQTNILALNAAVEAARAGEQGRGFAVVASEVRTLAQRSANAAKDIKNLISDSVSKIEVGNDLVNKSGETMQNIVVSIQRVNDIMGEIAAASVEQSTGIDEVGKAIIQMDEMTQQNAALVEEASAAAEKMTSQAEQLSRSVGSFTLRDDAIHSSKTKERQQQAAPRLSAQRQTKKTPIELPHSDDDEWESF